MTKEGHPAQSGELLGTPDAKVRGVRAGHLQPSAYLFFLVMTRTSLNRNR